jgi:hypothetical protein
MDTIFISLPNCSKFLFEHDSRTKCNKTQGRTHKSILAVDFPSTGVIVSNYHCCPVIICL